MILGASTMTGFEVGRSAGVAGGVLAALAMATFLNHAMG
jgi:hypothetical protein